MTAFIFDKKSIEKEDSGSNVLIQVMGSEDRQGFRAWVKLLKKADMSTENNDTECKLFYKCDFSNLLQGYEHECNGYVADCEGVVGSEETYGKYNRQILVNKHRLIFIGCSTFHSIAEAKKRILVRYDNIGLYSVGLKYVEGVEKTFEEASREFDW